MTSSFALARELPSQRMSTGRLLSSYFTPKVAEIMELMFSSVLKSASSIKKEQESSQSTEISRPISGSFHIEAKDIANIILSYILLKPFEFNAKDVRPVLLDNEIEFTRQTLHSLFNEGLPDGWLDLSFKTTDLIIPKVEMNTCTDPKDDSNACLRLMIRVNIQGHFINVIVNLGFSFINTVHFFRPFVNELFFTIPEPDKVDKIFNIKGFLDFSSEMLRMAINPINAAISFAYQDQLGRLSFILESLRIIPRKTGWDISFLIKNPLAYDADV